MAREILNKRIEELILRFTVTPRATIAKMIFACMLIRDIGPGWSLHTYRLTTKSPLLDNENMPHINVSKKQWICGYDRLFHGLLKEPSVRDLGEDTMKWLEVFSDEEDGYIFSKDFTRAEDNNNYISYWLCEKVLLCRPGDVI